MKDFRNLTQFNTVNIGNIRRSSQGKQVSLVGVLTLCWSHFFMEKLEHCHITNITLSLPTYIFRVAVVTF